MLEQPDPDHGLFSGDLQQAGWQGDALSQVSRTSADGTWRAGLAAWRAGDYDTAAAWFETMSAHERASPWGASAGAFWAARAHLFARRPAQVARWLNVAAANPETFYGLLAGRILGQPMPFRWQPAEADELALAALGESEAGQRIAGLIRDGQLGRAEQELRALVAQGRTDVAHGAMILAESSGMAELAFRLHRLLRPYGIEYHPAAYPIPRWLPEGGFSADRALIYALMRQESNFNPAAVSRAGARGVMQLMPATARFVVRTTGLPMASAAQLRRPEVNIALGQKYIEMLLADAMVGPDLFRLAAAWNGGPGNLERWQRDMAAYGDPLLFIETIPAGETRAFIERVLANLWIYRHRLGRPSPSLDALAAGQWPGYDGLDDTAVEIAEHEQE